MLEFEKINMPEIIGIRKDGNREGYLWSAFEILYQTRQIKQSRKFSSKMHGHYART